MRYQKFNLCCLIEIQCPSQFWMLSSLQDTPVLHAAVANLHSLCGVLERDMVCLSESCLSQAALTITLIMAKFPSLEEMEEQIQHGIEADFMKEVCNFVQLVVDMLTMQPTDFGQYPVQVAFCIYPLCSY